jgi:alanine-glyoxylate transaminase/serine-glyoxylate transaminase/serine-pyruvate transaminase
MKHNKNILMIPGPVQPELDVITSFGEPVRVHYGRDWTDFYNETRFLLKQVFQTKGDVHILVGSGSAGIDACLGSCFSQGEKILVGINGFFGERLKSIAESYGLIVVPVIKPNGTQILVSDIESTMKFEENIKGIALVHLETSTTIVNPIKEIGNFAKEKNLLFFVDAVSSLGGIQFNMDDWGVDVCATASQKCLGAPPGLSPVAVNDHGWKIIESKRNNNHGWYLNLATWKQFDNEWSDWHPFPITMATNNVVALNKSLEKLLYEGIESRITHYLKLGLRLRNGLRKLDIKPFTTDDIMAPVITAAYGFDDVPTSQLVNFLEQKHNIQIAGGLGELKDKIFRVGHMSPVITEEDIDKLLYAIRDFKGHKAI